MKKSNFAVLISALGILRIAVPLLLILCACESLAADSFYHCYIYSESFAAFKATITYLPLGLADQPSNWKSDTVDVEPGHQVLACTTSNRKVRIAASSDAAKLQWAEVNVDLGDNFHEFTYIIAAQDPKWNAPMLWPNLTGRSVPK